MSTIEPTAFGQLYRAVPLRSGRHSFRASALAVASAVALHAALITALSLGASAGKPPQHLRESAAGAQLLGSAEDFRSTIVFIDPEALSSDQGIESPGARLRPLRARDLLSPRLIRLSITHADLTSAGTGDSDTPEATSTSQVDGAAKALLFGRYIEQITARIDRLWVRPRTNPGGLDKWSSAHKGSAPASDRFQCRVQILQTADGRVLEVTLVSCSSSPQWQQSLVNAIDAASPLPAPPSESVFARSLILNFTSAAPAAAATPLTVLDEGVRP